MSDIFQIRNATSKDLACLPVIEAAAAKLFPSERIPNPQATHPEDLLQESLNNRLLFVADVSDEIVGFCTCTELARYLHLDELSVAPDFGRRGIGRALTIRALEESAIRELRGVTLTTFSDFEWNAPFYRKLGFCEFDPSDLPGHLQELLEREAAEGLLHRVGMVYSNEARGPLNPMSRLLLRS